MGQSIRSKCNFEKTRRAREMRRAPTPAEAALWRLLRRKVLGRRFRRQAVLRGWIADFWCPAARLIVEVDGSAHRCRQEADAYRDERLLAEIGAKTIRFRNEVVLENPTAVVAAIANAMEKRDEH